MHLLLRIILFAAFYGSIAVCQPLMAQDEHYRDSLRTVARHTSDPDGKAMALSLIAESFRFDHPDSAILYCYAGMHFSQQSKKISDIAYFHNFLGVLYKNTARYDSAIVHFEEAIRLNTIDSFASGVAACRNNLGKAYFLTGEFDQALNQYYQALSIFEQKHDTLNTGEVHSNIGALLTRIGEYKAAEEHLMLSRRQYRLAGARLQEAWILYDMGSLYLTTGRLQEASSLFNESSLIWKQFGRTKEFHDCMMRIGEIKTMQGLNDEALVLFSKAREAYIVLKDRAGEAESWLLSGRAYLSKGHASQAVHDVSKALNLAGYLTTRQLKLDVYKTLYQAYQQNRQHEKALEYLERYVALNDTLYNESRNQLLAEYQTKLNVNNKETIIRQLETEAERQQLINENISLRNQQIRNGIYALISLVLLIGLFLYTLMRRHKKVRKLNNELHNALKEREVLIREVHHRVKNNLQIISSLLNLQSEKTEGRSAKEILQISQSRIEAMSMIHENLYKSANLSEISFRDYVDNLCKYIETSFSLSEKGIVLQRQIDNIEVDIDQLVPCGLIMNELITNSIKHAFEGVSEKRINVVCTQTDHRVRIWINDNGKGLPEDFDVSKTKSLGMRLSQGLARQLKSELIIGNNQGFEAWFEFKNETK